MRPSASLLLSLLEPGDPGMLNALEMAAAEINGNSPTTPPVKQHGTPPQWEFSKRAWYIRACRKRGISIDQQRLLDFSYDIPAFSSSQKPKPLEPSQDS